MNAPDELISSALAENECGFVVYDQHDTSIGASAHHTFGAWTDDPVEDSGFTTFTDGAAGGAIKDFMVGWLLVPDVHQLAYLEIVEVDESSGNWVRVKGDADTLASAGSTYRIHAPPGVSTTTGALITGLEEAGSHWLWAGYEYVPPMVGFHNPEGQDPGTYGAQPGTNKLGSYHCWNRVYEPASGRWTSPDPAMQPWTNLAQYVKNTPMKNTDASGLGEWGVANGTTKTTAFYTNYYTLSFDEVRPFAYMGCGAFAWAINWLLSPSARRTGTIFQRVVVKWNSGPCGATAAGSEHFTEWWHIGAGGTKTSSRAAWTGANSPIDDTWSLPSEVPHGEGTEGTVSIYAVAVFVETGSGVNERAYFNGAQHPWTHMLSSATGSYSTRDFASRFAGGTQFPGGKNRSPMLISDSPVLRSVHLKWRCCKSEHDEGSGHSSTLQGVHLGRAMSSVE